MSRSPSAIRGSRAASSRVVSTRQRDRAVSSRHSKGDEGRAIQENARILLVLPSTAARRAFFLATGAADRAIVSG